jgi:hypothetical protein
MIIVVETEMPRKMPRKMPLVSLRALLSELWVQLHICFISNLSKSSTIKCYRAWWSFLLPRNEIDKGIGSRMMLSSGKYEFLILYQLYSFQSIYEANKKLPPLCMRRLLFFRMFRWGTEASGPRPRFSHFPEPLQ